MKKSNWVKFLKIVFVLILSCEIVIKHLIDWKVNDQLLNKYKLIFPYLYKSKSWARSIVYQQTFFHEVVEASSEKSKKLLYKINPHKYWQMKP